MRSCALATASSPLACDVRLSSFFFFSSRRRHTRLVNDWSSDVCSSDLEMKMGDVADFSNFVGAVIDASSFATQKEAIEEAKAADGKASIVAGGGYDDSDGWFVQPTVIETSDPDFRTMKEELFGPVVTAFVYDDSRYEDTLDLVDQGTSYGLTGAVFARDLQAIETARERLRSAAGNFYVNA